MIFGPAKKMTSVSKKFWTRIGSFFKNAKLGSAQLSSPKSRLRCITICQYVQSLAEQTDFLAVLGVKWPFSKGCGRR